MKKLVLAIMAIVLFVSNTNAQEKLSAEDQASLQEIVKKVTSVAEEKARVVTFELNYKESFELANFVVDEESELAKKLSSSLDEAKFNALKGNVKLTYANGDFEVFATDDINNIGNAILAHAKERLVKGLYVPRSLEGVVESLSTGQDINEILNDKDFQSYLIVIDKESKLKKDIKKIKEILSDNVVDENETKILYSVIGYENNEEFISNLKYQLELLNNLNNKYQLSKLTSNDLGILYNQGINMLNITSQNRGGHCARSYNNCMRIAFGIAVGAHLACTPLDVTVVAGLACHGAVALVHYSMQDDCELGYSDCIGG